MGGVPELISGVFLRDMGHMWGIEVENKRNGAFWRKGDGGGEQLFNLVWLSNKVKYLKLI